MRSWAIGIAAVAACASETAQTSEAAAFDPETAAFCNVNGAYSVSYKERSGTCGPLPEEIVTINEMQVDDDAADCMSSTRRSPNRCSAIVDSKCTVYNNVTGALVRNQRITGKTTVASSDASLIVGVYEIGLTDGRVSCRSTYDVTFRRL